MYEVLSRFRVCEPATRSREESDFLINYLEGVPVDYADDTDFVFSSSVNDYQYDGGTFNNVYANDRYGVQENFYFPSIGIRRKEMTWDTSTFPVQIDSTENGGFNLSGTVIGIKKISTVNTVDVSVQALCAIHGEITAYNPSTGAFTFTYTNLPSVYTETDLELNPLFNITSESSWYFGTYNAGIANNITINTPYNAGISTLEKYQEIAATVSSFDAGNMTITGTMATGLNYGVYGNITMIAPNNQKLRIIPMGYFDISNNVDGIPTATSLENMPNKSSLGLSSEFYYGIPYQTGYTYTHTSKDYIVRVPTFRLDFSSGQDLFMFAVAFEKHSTNRANPSGFKLGLSL